MKTISIPINIFTLFFVVAFLPTNICCAQQFYVTTSPLSGVDNKSYLLNIDSCTLFTDSTNLPVFSCSSQYHIDDIAFDKDDNIWYLNNYGELYKRKANDTVCQYVGQSPGGNNAMVADSSGNIYLAGGYALAGSHKSGLLSKYDGSSFAANDTLPNGVFSAGDLFFYENRLFLTATNSNLDSSYILEINLHSPKHSCVYMQLPDMRPYGVFTIKKENETARVFILSVDTPNYNSTALVEIDMPNKKVLNTLCTYPFMARGAASYYPSIWDSTSCPKPTFIKNYTSKGEYINTLNPVSNRIRVATNMTSKDIHKVCLYGLSGTLLKTYTPKEFPDKLDISTVPSGLYLLQIKSVEGVLWKEKVLKID